MLDALARETAAKRQPSVSRETWNLAFMLDASLTTSRTRRVPLRGGEHAHPGDDTKKRT